MFTRVLLFSGLVMAGGASGAAATDRVSEAVPVLPRLLVACKVTTNVPAMVGVPEITPAPATLKPGGRLLAPNVAGLVSDVI